MENTPHGHKSFQVYLKGQYSARYFFSLTLMICRIIPIRQSACLQMTVYYTDKIKNESDSQELQNDLNSLIKWEYDWQMHFNPQKCFVMRLTHARHLTRFNDILGDTSLQETDNHPYLGVHITKDLTWNKHIHQITATANRTLAFVRRNLYSCPQHINKKLPTQLLFVHFLNIHHPYGIPTPRH